MRLPEGISSGPAAICGIRIFREEGILASIICSAWQLAARAGLSNSPATAGIDGIQIAAALVHIDEVSI